MRHTLTVALLVISATTVFAGSRDHWYGTHCGTCVTPLVEDVNDCDDLRVILNDRDAIRSEEAVPIGDTRSLTIKASEAGGIYVRRTDATRFAVKACKAAEFGESLSRLEVHVAGDRVTSTGPGASNWVIYFLVDMPRGARADLGTTNGPIDIRGVTGTIYAHAENGPVGAKDTTGTIRLTAENGPVAFAGSSGDVTLRTDNGPIAVELYGTFWERGTLSARTDNGPVALKLPRNYRSGVTVDTDGRSPVKCRAEDCRSQRVRYGDDNGWPSHIDLGNGAVAVSVGTHNGPVAIDER